MNIAKAHTDRRCKFCRKPLFIGAAFLDLYHGKYIGQGCNDLLVWYLTINLIISER